MDDNERPNNDPVQGEDPQTDQDTPGEDPQTDQDTPGEEPTENKEFQDAPDAALEKDTSTQETEPERDLTPEEEEEKFIKEVNNRNFGYIFSHKEIMRIKKEYKKGAEFCETIVNRLNLED